jgi:hypothetical protein
MAHDTREIRAHIYGMLQANRAMLAPLAAQLRAGQLEAFPDARRVLERLAHTLNAHIDELEEHLRRLGGEAHMHTFSLRKYYTALASAHTAALLLETDARVQGFSSTAAMATRHGEEIAALLTRIRRLLPVAIKEEIDQVEIAT